jgi:hypothetical protein
MKKLENFESFRNDNNVLETSQSMLIFGGFEGNTNDWCFTLNDTCQNKCSDIRHIRERDGVVQSDVISDFGTDCSQ